MTVRRQIAPGLLVVAGGALAVVILSVFVRFRVDRFRPEVIAYFEAHTGKKTDIQRLALTFFPRFTIHVYGIDVKSPPPFPPSDVLEVAQADVLMNPWALLRGAVVIKSLVLKGVVIDLVSAPDGRWNFENPQGEDSKNSFPMGVIDSVLIEDARLSISNLLSSGAVGPAFVEAHDVTSTLTVVNLAAIVNPSSPSLIGRGTWQAARVRFGAVETTDVTSTIRLESWQVSIADARAQAYSGTVTGNFSLSLAKADASFTADARMGGIDVAHLLAAFHEQRASVTGKLEGDLTLEGEVAHTASPLAELHGTGHARLTDGQMASLMANSNTRALARFNDRGPALENPASFASIAADLQLANLWVSSKAITIDGYGVDVDGSGSVSVSGSDELHYRGVATIATKQGFWTNTFARLGGGTLKDGKLSFPFRIEGTIENPTLSRTTNDK